MISKKVTRNRHKKSDFSNLVRYLISDQKRPNRVARVRITNCNTPILSFALEAVEAVQNRNVRAKSDKTYHLIISFREGEDPKDSILDQIEERFIKELGYERHQRISVLHRDTQNVHIHVAINKISPVNFKLHDPSYDFKIRDRVCAELEQEFSLQEDSHRYSSLAQAYEQVDVQDTVEWLRCTALEKINSAGSWADLHNLLDAMSIRLELRGNGCVFRIGNNRIKASSVSRELSKAKLEGRLGAFSASLKSLSDKDFPVEDPNMDPFIKKTCFNKEPNSSLFLEKIRTDRVLILERSLRDADLDRLYKSAKLKRRLLKGIHAHFLVKKFLYAQIYAATKKAAERIQDRYTASTKERSNIIRREFIHKYAKNSKIQTIQTSSRRKDSPEKLRIRVDERTTQRRNSGRSGSIRLPIEQSSCGSFGRAAERARADFRSFLSFDVTQNNTGGEEHGYEYGSGARIYSDESEFFRAVGRVLRESHPTGVKFGRSKISAFGRKPNDLSSVSQRDVVRKPSGSKVFLSDNVDIRVEHRPPADSSIMRRSQQSKFCKRITSKNVLSREPDAFKERNQATQGIVERFIAARSRYTDEKSFRKYDPPQGPFVERVIYKGLRSFEGSSLLLMTKLNEKSGTIFVWEVSEMSKRRIRRTRVGQELEIASDDRMGSRGIEQKISSKKRT